MPTLFSLARNAAESAGNNARFKETNRDIMRALHAKCLCIGPFLGGDMRASGLVRRGSRGVDTTFEASTNKQYKHRNVRASRIPHAVPLPRVEVRCARHRRAGLAGYRSLHVARPKRRPTPYQTKQACERRSRNRPFGEAAMRPVFARISRRLRGE